MFIRKIQKDSGPFLKDAFEEKVQTTKEALKNTSVKFCIEKSTEIHVFHRLLSIFRCIFNKISKNIENKLTNRNIFFCMNTPVGKLGKLTSYSIGKHIKLTRNVSPRELIYYTGCFMFHSIGNKFARHTF